MRTIIQNKFSHFQLSDISPKSGLREAFLIFGSWFIPACIFVLLVSKYGSSNYFYRAISEGIGPHLWNVIGAFGYSLFGAALIFPSCTYIALAANRVLINVYGIGCLMLGLLLGQELSGFSGTTIKTWQAWLYGVEFIFLFLAVLGLNFVMWYLSFLVYDPRGMTPFVQKVRQLGLLSISIGLVVLALPLFIMFTKH